MLKKINGKTLELILGDITEEKVDAIVNAANAELSGGGGVDGAIHSAGGPAIMAEGRKLGGCPTGSACVTTAGKLKASYVIHAVGPIWRGGGSGEAELLASAYRASLKQAEERSLASISFPAISAGAYAYPLDAAAELALVTVISHLRGRTSLEAVRFVLYNQAAYDVFADVLERLEPQPVAAGKSSFDLIDTEQLLAILSLSSGEVVLDVASGAGNYTLAIATANPDVTVFAVDLWSDGVEELGRRASAAALGNVHAAVADVSEEIPLPENSVDSALIATALHDLVEENVGEAALSEICRVLKPGGRLIIVEFKKIDGPPGPPRNVRLSAEQLDDLVRPHGFSREQSVDAGPYIYISTYLRDE